MADLKKKNKKIREIKSHAKLVDVQQQLKFNIFLKFIAWDE